MKDFTKYIWCLTLAASVACGKSDVPEGGPQQVEVTFTTEVRTRVQRADVVTGFKTGDEMTLYRVEDGAQASASRIACTEGLWRGTPAVMLEPSKTASFQAVYPYARTATDPAAYPVSVAAQTDYLYSGPPVAVRSNAPGAKLVMHHAQAILAFNIRSYIGGELLQITIADQTFPLKGTMNLTDGRIAVTQHGSYDFDCPRTLSRAGWTTGHPACFVFPWTVTAGQCTAIFRLDGGEYAVPIPRMAFKAGNKYILHFSLTARGALFHPERTEVVTLDADGGDVDQTYSCLRVTHRNQSYTAPQITGSSLYGMIYWDETTAEPFAPEATHAYTSEGPHTVTFDLWQADAVRFSDLEGIERIDLSQF